MIGHPELSFLLVPNMALAKMNIFSIQYFVTFYDVEFNQHENEIDDNFYQNQDKESKLPRHPCQHLSNKVTKNASKITVKSF